MGEIFDPGADIVTIFRAVDVASCSAGSLGEETRKEVCARELSERWRTAGCAGVNLAAGRDETAKAIFASEED